MEGHLIGELIKQYGVPAAVLFVMWWENRRNNVKPDPTSKLFDKLEKIDERQDELNNRMIRLETKVERLEK